MNSLLILVGLATLGMGSLFFAKLQAARSAKQFAAILTVMVLPIVLLLTFEPQTNMGGFNYQIYMYSAKMLMHGNPFERTKVLANFELKGEQEYQNPKYLDYPASQVWVHAQLLRAEYALKAKSGLKSWNFIFDHFGFRSYFLFHFLVAFFLASYLVLWSGGSKLQALMAASLTFAFFILSYNVCYEMKMQSLSSCLATVFICIKAQKRPILYILLGFWAAHFGITLLLLLVLLVSFVLPTINFTGWGSIQIRWLPILLVLIGLLLPFLMLWPHSLVPWAMRAQRLAQYEQAHLQSLFSFAKAGYSIKILYAAQIAFVAIMLFRYRKLEADLGLLVFCSACFSLWLLPDFNWNRLPALLCLGFLFGKGNKTIEYWAICLVLLCFISLEFLRVNGKPMPGSVQVVIANILPLYYLVSLCSYGSRWPRLRMNNPTFGPASFGEPVPAPHLLKT